MGIFYNVGYYISEFATPLDWMVGITAEKLITPSRCICNLHPDFDGCFWMNHKKDETEYQIKLKANNDEFSLLKKSVSDLFEKNMLAMDGRFIQFDDAITIYNRFFKDKINGILIGVFAEKTHVDYLTERNNQNGSAKIGTEQLIGDFMGHDIIGWDMDGFHSYICNSLQNI